jgi:hypothetical protein
MNGLDFAGQPSVFMEIGQISWQVFMEDEVSEFPLERLENGSLAEAGRERLVAGLRKCVNKKGWRPRRRAFVALGARGVSLRRLALPPAPREEFQRLLRLQIESEFPLSPDELAWGWQMLGQNSGRQEVLVAAIKKEIVESYVEILAVCGITPVFTVAALARQALCPPPLPSCAVLWVGVAESELLTYQDGAPASIRLLPWGSERTEPLNAKSIAGQIYLTGPGARRGAYPVLECGNAIAGLRKVAAGGGRPLIIQAGESNGRSAGAGTWKWAATAAALLVALLCFPYVEAVALKPHLVKKLAAIDSDRARLPAIDHELDFLEFLKRSQPPYLDTIYLIAKFAPPGTSFESLAMTRRGEFSVRGKLPNAQQVTEFRSNLIQSAWFSSVVVEEQTPTPDRQVSVRMTAQVKPVDARKPLVVDVPATKPEHETNSPPKK